VYKLSINKNLFENILLKKTNILEKENTKYWMEQYKNKQVKTKKAFGYSWVQTNSWDKLKNMLKEIKSGQRQWNHKLLRWEIMNTGRWCSEKLLESRNQIITIESDSK